MQSEPGTRRRHLQQHHPPQGGADRGAEVHRHAAGLQRHTPGVPFNRNNFGLSFSLKNGLRFHFDSETCLNQGGAIEHISEAKDNMDKTEEHIFQKLFY